MMWTWMVKGRKNEGWTLVANRWTGPSKPFKVWKDLNWTLTHDGYYRCWKRGPFYQKMLHVEMWKEAKGPIPKGFHVDHIDQNKENNTLENFQLLGIVEHAHKSNAHKRHLKERNNGDQDQSAPQEQEAIAPEPWDLEPIEGIQHHTKGGEEPGIN